MSDTETPMQEDVEQEFEVRINDLVSRLEENAKVAKTIAGELKVLKKEHNKIVKKITGTRRKKVPKDPNAPKKAPSGFAKPTKISAELAAFLGVSEGEMIARPDVTKGITAYVKKHNLQNEENRRIIDLSKPGGEALTELLNVPEGQELTFFNLQKYLKIHFPQTVKEPKAPKAPKEPKAKADKPAAKPRAKKAAKTEEHDEEAEEAPVKETKKRASKKAAEPVESEDAPVAPVKATKKTAKKADADEEVPVAPVKASRASKAKQAKTVEHAEDEEVAVEEAPVEDAKPRRRRRAEEP
jgi:chromatin remodeling complex protein RSC6